MMVESTEPEPQAGDSIVASEDNAAPSMPVDNLGFADFSKAFDEVKKARKGLEKYGTARLANPHAPEVIAAQRAFVHAVKRYDAIVAALIKPMF